VDAPARADRRDQLVVKEQLSALTDVGELLDRSGFDYWLFGGWAVDFHVGTVTRKHDDVDLAVWLHDAEAVGASLQAHAWQHKPHPGEDGGTGYERGRVRIELTYLASDDTGGTFIPLRDRSAPFSHEPLGNGVRELLGVRARVIPLGLLRAGKSSPRHDLEEAAKDRADFEALSHLE
jgi:hypothetical protein